MIVKILANHTKLPMISASARYFSYDQRELKKLDMEFQRKLNMLRMYTEQKEFNYE